MSLNNKICERCKSENAVFYCEECSPFHNFCKRCDSIIHSLSIKINHQRKNLINIPESNSNIKYISNDLNSNISNNVNNLNLNNNNNSCENIINQNNELNQLYTNEYVTELKKLFDQEKNELKYKINSL